MRFTHHNLGYRKSGEVAVVTLTGNAANVRLMDSTNFQSYKAGRRYKFFGGLADKSSFRVAIPNTGYWHVAVDLQGLRGQVRSSVNVA